MKYYWHKIPTKRQIEIISSGITIGQFEEKYQQPKWCSYPRALQGVLGCWSLVYKRVSKSFCRGCECKKKGR